MKTTCKNVRTTRNRTRRALVEALDSRKLLAGDIGMEVCAPYDPNQDVSAEVSVVQGEEFGPVQDFTDQSDVSPDSKPRELPVAEDDVYKVTNDQSVSGNVMKNDPSATSGEVGYQLTAIVTKKPAHGTLEFNGDGSFTYTPDNGFVGTDAFAYTLNDGEHDGEAAAVTIQVAAGTTSDPVKDGEQQLGDDDGSSVGEEEADEVYRQFGDSDGDGIIGVTDFLAFRTALGSSKGDAEYDSVFDVDSDGSIEVKDFLAFRQVFGTSV